MEWLNEVVDQILKKYPNESIYNCVCGLSTTGISHIGNFRELMITYFVYRELKNRGKEAKMILSFDDFDRFKKVPYGVDASFEKYIGMPNYSIPSPKNSNMKYAEYYENLVVAELNKLGIDASYVKQSEKYINNDYIESIKYALANRYEIFDIISKHKTQKLTEKDREEYYPVRVYCSFCNRDSTVVTKYTCDDNFLSYTCSCGYCEKNKLDKLKVKLKFNVDWPMRWNYENAHFEPCGKGHADKNGALAIGKEINKKIFKKPSPVVISYEFLNIIGNNGRMNKGSKDIVTITDALDVMSNKMIMWYFLMNHPKKEMTFSIGDNIIKLYEEYEKFLKSNNNENLKIKRLLEINDKSDINFKTLLHYLPIVNFDIDKLNKYIKIDLNNKDNLTKIKYAIEWLKKYSNNKYWILKENFDKQFYDSMTYTEKNEIKLFLNLLNNYRNENDVNEFLNLLRNKKRLKQFSNNFYHLAFGTNYGIPIKTVIENYDIDKIKYLLGSNNKEKVIINNNNISLLHLSDLHFDIEESNDELFKKWILMIDKIKKSQRKINYLVLSGDIVCFYNLNEDFDLAYNYIKYLMNELSIDKENVHMCMGNHELIAFDDIKDYDALMNNYDGIIKNRIEKYAKFQKKINGRNIDSIDDLYYIKKDNLIDFFVINSLYCFDKNKNGIFLQNNDVIRRKLEEYRKGGLYSFIVSHAPYDYNKDMFDDTGICDRFRVNLCGHKHDKKRSHVIIDECAKNVDLISGNKEGFVDSINNYNICDLRDNKIYVKKLCYSNNHWSID